MTRTQTIKYCLQIIIQNKKKKNQSYLRKSLFNDCPCEKQYIEIFSNKADVF